MFQKDSRDSFSLHELPRRIIRRVKRQSFPLREGEIVTRKQPKIIEPIESPLALIDASRIFEQCNWAPADAKWLGALSVSVTCSHLDQQDALDSMAQERIRSVAGSADIACPRVKRDRALLVAFARLCCCAGMNGPLHWNTPSPLGSTSGQITTSKRQEIAREFRKNGANFEAALMSGEWPGNYDLEDGFIWVYARGNRPMDFEELPQIVRLMRALCYDAALDLSAVIDGRKVSSIGSRWVTVDPELLPRRVPEQIRFELPTISDSTSLLTWMIGVGTDALDQFYTSFQNCPDHELASMAVGVQCSIEHWLFCKQVHWTSLHAGGSRLARACLPYFNHLWEKSFPLKANDQDLRRSCLWFARCVLEADPNIWKQLSQQVQVSLLQAANEDLSKLRPLFARATLKPKRRSPDDDTLSRHLLPSKVRTSWEEFEFEQSHFETCASLLFQCGGLWKGMKPLLLAIRAFGCPCVARDLRYWDETTHEKQLVIPDELDQPPEPWRIVPSVLINSFHRHAGAEQSIDPELTSLRGELARFCLERLGDRLTKDQRVKAEHAGQSRTDDDMVERSPIWRLCLVRAAASLYINPEGKGHRVLELSSRIDPDIDVREAAHAAFQQIRRQKPLPENVSPRRAVMSAIWWLRQAHILELGIELDGNGAQRTRVKELTRTKEVERANKLDTESI